MEVLMTTLLPQGITVDAATGALGAETGRFAKRLADLKGLFADQAAYDEAVARRGNPLVYEVIEYRKDGSDIFFGTTTMQPGSIGGEFYFTRGHFHERPDRAEVYYTQSGEGVLLLQSRDGRTSSVEMKPGVCAFIPPDWAHRSVNTGGEPLVFVWFGNQDAGHDYGKIAEQGLGQRVLEQGGKPVVVPA
jgi:glucose-6-phosphate isomerase, archaeal